MDFDFSELEKMNTAADFNGALAVTTPDRVLYTASRGIADYATGIPFTLQTTSGIGSVSKQFLATVVLMLAAEKRLHLTDKLAEYLPEYRFADQITLRQLLNMAAGVPDYVDVVVDQVVAGRPIATPDDDPQVNRAVGENIPLTQALALINPLPLTYTPGSESRYSNSNYLLLGTVVERILGAPLSVIFAQRLFAPLGMTQTKLGTQYAQADSYLRTADNRLITIGRGHHTAGDGGIITSITDLTRWAQAILQHRFLGPAVWQEAMTLYKDFYGFAWLRRAGWSWHGGRVLGFQADIYVAPAQQLATTWVYNVTPVDDPRLATWYQQRDAWHARLL
ncbi:serine hydrolase [Schleiferilactobacillus harbinensis]|uniref:Protein PbpE n=1 Tax=Schleiferilactobacillus harbinensis DSM 16991 TaxID=1122147 RepID=A0A0R1XDC1_9LACO|nr:serine hydrolase domain-containing protein [Schleiferilactobacillus harbinensis]KRM28046.1 protein PbpE [Schleiferilactobacillus harbinensis DSM 16991]MBO3092906.1 beta-lactamase family protein [Schleiferilactobacillus harbinensis]QFR63555.1 serine hydrolase [Schleiferilactobacillus harbinensis]